MGIEVKGTSPIILPKKKPFRLRTVISKITDPENWTVVAPGHSLSKPGKTPKFLKKKNG
jgi:hypothetical protein